LRWTIWAQVFVVSLAISTVALYRPGPAVREADRQHPFLLKGIRGALVGALAALVANDSGVVAAATLMIPVTATLMYLMLVQRANVTRPSRSGAVSFRFYHLVTAEAVAQRGNDFARVRVGLARPVAQGIAKSDDTQRHAGVPRFVDGP